MLQIYGTPLSSPTNKVRYVANYLGIPYDFHRVNLAAGEQRKPEFMKINPLGKIPAIQDEGFTLAESNAIIRYLATKNNSNLYPTDLQQRALVDQWIDYSSQHVTTALGRIMFNTYFYKLTGGTVDERSLEDGRKFINQYLPVLEQQLTQNTFIAGKTLTLADFVLISALDVTELCQVDLSSYAHIVAWRKKMMAEKCYQSLHESYTVTFKTIMEKLNTARV